MITGWLAESYKTLALLRESNKKFQEKKINDPCRTMKMPDVPLKMATEQQAAQRNTSCCH